MSNANSKSAASEVVIAAARAEATRLCDRALAAVAKLGATPDQRARAKRYQIEEFSRTSARVERVVCGLVEFSTREDLLTAIAAYCEAGIAEVESRFAL
jgi:hypothetical protein